MNYRLFWKLCLIIATGAVALFYLVDLIVDYTEEDMSLLADADRAELRSWAAQAELLYKNQEITALEQWLDQLAKQENTWVSIAEATIKPIAGDSLDGIYHGYHMGRSIDVKIHLYFNHNPVMEIPFKQSNVSFLIKLPERMRPGSYWPTIRLLLQVFIPLSLLSLASFALYRHIMSPIKQLQKATNEFTQGHFDVRVQQLLGNRDDELADLAKTFDSMADNIGELIINQRQLIANLSHELRTPLARLEIAIECMGDEKADKKNNLQRLQRESQQIRKLVEDTLTLAWLNNEKPVIQQETLDLVDLIDVLVSDARYEFADRNIDCQLPETAIIENSSHQAVGQALENILRNAMRYTPANTTVSITLSDSGSLGNSYAISICDQGPGVNEELLEKIFKPFFRVDKARTASASSFGLGLALAQRQIQAVRGRIWAENNQPSGLIMHVLLPKK
jgi:two-component system sensor histidine kinase PfeS